MFPSKSKVIIAIKDNKLNASKVSFKMDKPVIEEQIEKEFTPETLAEVFTQVKQELKTNSVRLLLPENKTYLELLELPLGTPITRGLVLEKAQEAIPEILENGYFDWRRVDTNPPAGEAGQKSLKIQVLAVTKDYLLPLQQAAQKANLSLEAFEPASFALARLTREEKDPHLIICQNQEKIICTAHQDQVFGTVTVDDQSQIETKARELVDYTQKEWGVEIKRTIKENLEPTIGLALKPDIKDKDEEVLNLAPPKTATPVEKGEKNKRYKELLLIGLIVITLLILITGGLLGIYKKAGDEKKAVEKGSAIMEKEGF